MSRTPKSIAVLLATTAVGASALGAGVLAGPASASSTEVLKLSANGSGMLMFNTTKLTAAKPGKIEIVLTNPASSGIPHGIEILGHGVKVTSKIASPGQTVSVTATLKAGSYEYLCPVPGHAQAGMRGTLTVK